MKNLTLLRLAGFGLFGVTSVSPGSSENNDWLLDELRSVQILPTIPFTTSAFCQETNYPKKPTHPDTIQNYWLDIPRSEELTEQLPDPAPIPTPVESTPPPQVPRKNIEKTRSSSAALQVKDCPAEVAAQSPGDSYDLTDPDLLSDDSTLIYTPEESGSNTAEYAPQPPVDYVDEVKRATPITEAKSIIPIISRSTETGLSEYPHQQLFKRIDKICALAERLGYSNKYAFLLNLGLKSGKKRFLVIDLQNKTIITSGLVAHGRGREKFTLSKKYSNLNGSSCSSLGLYKIGASYYGNFGKSFRLIGLEKTNNNALTRAIVLHSMGCIPDEEIDYPICQSEGCPSVSPAFLAEISKIIRNSDKPILLWAFDPTVEQTVSP